MLPWTLYLSFLGALALMLLPAGKPCAARIRVLMAAIAGLVCALGATIGYKPAAGLLTVCKAPWAVALSALGLLVTAVVLLTLGQRVFHGALNENWLQFLELTLREHVLVAVPVALMFVRGIYPQLLLGVINGAIVRMVGQLKF